MDVNIRLTIMSICRYASNINIQLWLVEFPFIPIHRNCPCGSLHVAPAPGAHLVARVAVRLALRWRRGPTGVSIWHFRIYHISNIK